MAANETVNIILDLLNAKYKANAKETERLSERLTKKLEAQSKRLRNASLVFGGALAGQLLLVKKVTKAAGIQEAAERRLGDALELNAGVSRDYAKALIAQAAALQQQTKFGDEAILQLQALLVTYGVAVDQIEDATRASLDFAAATGRDLKTAALTVGKAVGAGFTAELSRYGIVVDTSTIPKTQVATAVLKKLNEQFGGRAQAEVNTFEGRMAQLSNAVGDLQEGVGFALIPILVDLSLKIKPVVERATQWISANQKLLAIIIGGGVGGTGLLFAISSLGFAVVNLAKFLLLLQSPTAIATLGILAVAGALAVLALRSKAIPTDMAELNAALENERQKLSDLGDQIFDTRKKHGLWQTQLGDDPKFIKPGVAELRNLQTEYTSTQNRIEDLEKAKKNLVEQERLEKLAREGVNDAQQNNIENIKTEREETGAFIDENLVKLIGMYKLLALQIDDLTDEKLNNLREQWERAFSDTGTQAETLENRVQQTAEGMADAMAGTFDTILSNGENAFRQLGDVFGASLLRMMRAAIEFAVGRIIAQKIEAIAVASIQSVFDFGLSLLKIAPIAAAAAAGIAGLRALEGRFAAKNIKGFATGGLVGRGGGLVHAGEIVFNPQRNTGQDLAAMMSASALAGGVNVFPAYNGPISNVADMDAANRQLGEEVRRAILP